MTEAKRLARWRLVLGNPAAEALGVSLEGEAADRDRVLGELYDAPRRGGLEGSSPRVVRWLGDIRRYFPASCVQVMQADALEKLNLRQMLLEPELLRSVQPDVHLVATLMSLSRVMPRRSRDTARDVVRRVVDDLMRRLRQPTLEAVRGSLNRAARTSRPRPGEIDWDRTVRLNLKHWLPERRALVPERVVGYARRRPRLRDVVLAVDQSGSMAPSVVYSGIFGAVLASVPALRTRFVVFDTAVVDLSEQLADPIELLFGAQLGGGTDIAAALAHCQELIDRPSRTILVLISDLCEGGDAAPMMRRAHELVASGVQVICLLALSDEGAPAFDASNASKLAALGIPTFACTPDLFPDLMATAILRRDVSSWASRHDILATRPAVR